MLFRSRLQALGLQLGAVQIGAERVRGVLQLRLRALQRVDRRLEEIEAVALRLHARDEAVEQGVTINGLPLVGIREWMSPADIRELDVYYEDCVIGGPEAFSISVRDVKSFVDATRTKLVREIASLPQPSIQGAMAPNAAGKIRRAQAPEPGHRIGPWIEPMPDAIDVRHAGFVEAGESEATGDAFKKQPILGDAVAERRPPMKSGHVGKYWIGTYERGLGDEASGTLTSNVSNVTPLEANAVTAVHATRRYRSWDCPSGVPASNGDEPPCRIVVLIASSPQVPSCSMAFFTSPRSRSSFVAASLLFCIGAMAILGSIKDGLGQGNDILLVKSTLDFFAAIAFASTFGWGVAASALSLAVYQGGFTLVGALLGNVISPAQIAVLSAVGGLLILGIALRLLKIRQVAIGNMLPALIIAPVLVGLLALVFDHRYATGRKDVAIIHLNHPLMRRAIAAAKNRAAELSG